MAATVDVTGASEVARYLAEVGDNAEHQKETLEPIARNAARSVTGVPVDTGKLAGSMEVLEVTDSGFAVGSRVPYARYVFHGTRYMDARPPRLPDHIATDAAAAIGSDITRAH